MCAANKLRYSKMGIIILMVIVITSFLSTICAAQTVLEVIPSADTAKTVASMNAMQLMAYITLASLAALVVVVGFYVRSVTAFQKEISGSLATISTTMKDMADGCRAYQQRIRS